MEVSAREHGAIVEDERVVRRGVELRRDQPLGESDGLEHRPVHLRHAAQRVGVLHARVVRTVRLADLAPFEQGAQQGCRFLLGGLPARLVDARVERRRRAEQRLERRGTGRVCRHPAAPCPLERECGHRCVRLCAVDQREPLLGAERDGGQAVGAQHLRRGPDALRGPELALADEREREVRERREVAAGAHRALLGDRRVEAGAEHPAEQVHELWASTGDSLREHVGAEQHHRPHLALREPRADAGRMAAHEVHLQLRELVRRDREVGELSEPGVHAVHRLAPCHDGIHDPARGRHPRACRRRQTHGAARLCHVEQGGDGERGTVELEWGGIGHGTVDGGVVDGGR